MNYVAQSRSPNPAAMLGALGVPGAFGALLVIGLAVTVTNTGKDEDIITWDVPVDPPDLPPPPPKPDNPAPANPATPTTPVEQVVIVPDAPIDLGPALPIEVGTLPPIDTGLIPGPVGTGRTGTTPPPPPLPDPITASPRNAPGGWITDSDYKSRWIREGREGRARFRLEISASGRVSNCEILGSTGHTVLDLATCRLITRRARFDPARDSTGAKVPGTFSSSVNWQIPE